MRRYLALSIPFLVILASTIPASTQGRAGGAGAQPEQKIIPPEARYWMGATTLGGMTALGGGMSSRLFQTIREERGMAYSIYSDLSPYSDTGSLCVYAGTSAGKALEVVDLVMAEFRSLKETPLSDEELTRAKDQLKGNILMGLESSNSRMANLARQEMYFHNFMTVEEVIARISAVDAAQVQAMAQRLFDPDRIAITLLGRLNGIKLTRSRLVC